MIRPGRERGHREVTMSRRRGRPVVVHAQVSKLEASEMARRRLELLLETLQGTRTVQSVASELGVTPQRVHQLRDAMLAGAADALEPAPRGRPPAVSEELDEREALAERVAELEVAQRALELQLELALLMPETLKPARGGKRRGRCAVELVSLCSMC